MHFPTVRQNSFLNELFTKDPCWLVWLNIAGSLGFDSARLATRRTILASDRMLRHIIVALYDHFPGIYISPSRTAAAIPCSPKS